MQIQGGNSRKAAEKHYGRAMKWVLLKSSGGLSSHIDQRSISYYLEVSNAWIKDCVIGEIIKFSNLLKSTAEVGDESSKKSKCNA